MHFRISILFGVWSKYVIVVVSHGFFGMSLTDLVAAQFLQTGVFVDVCQRLVGDAQNTHRSNGGPMCFGSSFVGILMAVRLIQLI
jgi:hypothetical protein